MKKLLLIFALFIAIASSAQIKEKAVVLADSVIIYKPDIHRSVIVADTSNNYYIVFGDYAFKVKSVNITAKNNDNQKLRMFMSEGDSIQVEFPNSNSEIIKIKAFEYYKEDE